MVTDPRPVGLEAWIVRAGESHFFGLDRSLPPLHGWGTGTRYRVTRWFRFKRWVRGWLQ